MMAYIRKKKIKGYTYYYVVEGKQDERGKIKQKVLYYIGTIETLLKKLKIADSILKKKP